MKSNSSGAKPSDFNAATRYQREGCPEPSGSEATWRRCLRHRCGRSTGRALVPQPVRPGGRRGRTRLFTRGGAEKLGLRSQSTFSGASRVNVHKNARLTPSGRALLAERIETGWPIRSAAQAAGVSVRTARKWLVRHRLGGECRHHDRSSAPRRCPRRTEPRRMAEIEALRRHADCRRPPFSTKSARLGHDKFARTRASALGGL